MHVVRLSIHRLRRFHTVELHPSSTLNLLTGDNGAGKTSVLEALHLMAYGRSFRGRVRDGLIQQGANDLEVFVEWKEGNGAAGERTRRAGLRHSGQEWTGRLDGEDVAQLGALCAALAVVTFEPGSHVLISGGGEPRRRFLDWGLFHVEPDFLTMWRRYARALKQRNALLKQGAQPRMLDAWDHELAESGESLTSRRTRYLERLQERLVPVADAIAPALGLSALTFAPGWKRHEVSLADALLLARERDRQNGYTSQGPHRADWVPSFQALPGRDALSRGQAKLTALACLLAQAEDFAYERGEWPVIALDDLGSELDRHHQGRVLQRLACAPAQVLITATETPPGLADAGALLQQFHVEHGHITRQAAAH
ncbi:DNA replication/repair protein RecF [Xanthomonas campestris pv. zingibericola]|uniref:DNA replication/repair protein RecF n=1 Tax=Xanthomonas TaxID=338 RepID=UPI000F00564E|nr:MULTISPECIES: DNA replication/repair protein RecF [Xanthomonas]AYO93662.1 DNA replication/repair protein RecF [Xanthomonas axonopodis pv. commiphoreae]MBV6841298.1 DNA replication/repair protein RecF [Xanthomonas campestris pv. fici]MBV6859022.1 DNA replication/repair protein RecF [Xanthomonas campestris pv. zingibericola]MBV6864907.1 DNA replication/repair protein RecF [Xanthomonas campestris pv. coriandri]MBV6889086.1 DNA replication/repair protein RecF [Xanthomonas campestris pv. spermac